MPTLGGAPLGGAPVRTWHLSGPHPTAFHQTKMDPFAAYMALYSVHFFSFLLAFFFFFPPYIHIQYSDLIF